MKLGVCVPYRNRESHLKEFVPKVGAYLESKGIDYCMYFAHQVDDKLFKPLISIESVFFAISIISFCFIF